jgi:ribosome-associated protein
MKKINIKISGSYIELIKLLKLSGLSSTGSEAKMRVMNGDVKVDGITESRLRSKIRIGNKVELDNTLVELE